MFGLNRGKTEEDSDGCVFSDMSNKCVLYSVPSRRQLDARRAERYDKAGQNIDVAFPNPCCSYHRKILHVFLLL